MQRLKLQLVLPSLSPSRCSHVSLKPNFRFSSSKVSPWPGLCSWRESPLNENRNWGPNGPQPEPESEPIHSPFGQASSLAELGSIVLSTADPLTKSRLSHMAYSLWRRRNLPVGRSDPPSRPARPEKPQLVSPKEIPAPKNSDFLHIRLAELGFKYGDMPAHNLLWRECEKSSDNVAARLAVIPLVQEARGLDAGPRLVQKLVGFGDNWTSKIVARIAEEEVAHVAVGLYWFLSVCQKMDCAPDSTFKDLLKEYNVELKGPFNYTAREEAGIPRDWYDALSSSNEDKKDKDGYKKQLSPVYERLASIIAMERENSSLAKPPE